MKSTNHDMDKKQQLTRAVPRKPARKRLWWIAAIALAAAITPAVAFRLMPTAHTGQSGRMRIIESYGKLPLSFEANQGQTDPQVRFLSRGSGYTLFLTPTEVVLALRPAPASNPRQKSDPVHLALESEAAQAQAAAVLRMKVVGSSSAPRLVGLDELPGKSNYFLGNDPKKWRTNVPSYSRVRYENVYAGVDLIYYGSQGQLEYDFVVAPGSAPDAITLGFEGTDEMAIDPQGNLVLSIGSGEVSLHKPVVYQEVDGVRRVIQGGYALKEGNRVGFQVAAYDADKPLVIDPTLAYSTYLGGSSADGAFFFLPTGIAVDAGGNAYVTGGTASTDFPTTTGSSQTASGGDFDVFVTKLSPTGSTLVYSTYLGGSGTDVGTAIAVDTSGNAYVTGQTNGSFPTTTGAFQTAFGSGSKHVFVTKFDSTGSTLVYSTYLGGGSGTDASAAITVDASGNAYVTGSTNSATFPTTTGAFQTVCGGCNDAFVTKFNSVGSALVYSTYLGGSNGDSGSGIAVDSSGNAYVTGSTGSTNFPTTTGAFQTIFGGGSNDAFVTKLNPTGSGLIYSTYLGGSSQDAPFPSNTVRIAIDSAGNAYVTGATNSANFPTTVGAFQSALGGGSGFDVFLSKLNPMGSALVYSTYLGGSGFDGGYSIAVDSAGNAYITGQANSTDFPTASPIQASPGGGEDAFVAKFNPTGSALVYSTYLGGSSSGAIDEFGSGIAVDTVGNAYVTGMTDSTDFPTTAGAFQTTFGGGGTDAFVAKISSGAPPSGADLAVTKGGAPDPIIEGDNLTYTLNVTNSGPSGATNVTLTDPLPTGVTFVSATSAQGSCSNASGTVTCNLGSMASAAQVAVTIVGRPTGAASLSNTASVTATESDPNPANNSATATGTALGFTLSNTSGTITLSPGETGHFTIRATPGAGGFPNAITFSSSNLPSTVTGSFNTTSATPGNSPVDVVFTLATTASASVSPHRIPVQRPWPIIPMVCLSALMLLWALLRHQEPRLRPQVIVPLVALLLATSFAGCNDTKALAGGTPPGTYDVTLTATSGTASHTTTATLVVR